MILYYLMVTLYEFVYDELNQPESIDLVGLGAGQEEKKITNGYTE